MACMHDVPKAHGFPEHEGKHHVYASCRTFTLQLSHKNHEQDEESSFGSVHMTTLGSAFKFSQQHLETHQNESKSYEDLDPC